MVMMFEIDHEKIDNVDDDDDEDDDDDDDDGNYKFSGPQKSESAFFPCFSLPVGAPFLPNQQVVSFPGPERIGIFGENT